MQQVKKLQIIMKDYQKQAEDFLIETGTSFRASFKAHDFYFPDDKEPRDIYNITLKNNRHKYKFQFGQSINNQGEVPNSYDVLSCLQKHEAGSFENFCSDCGYDTDSRNAEKVYKAVEKEYYNIIKLFTTEELEKLHEIE